MPRRIPTHKPRVSLVGIPARTKQDEARALRSQARWIKCSQAGRRLEPLCCDPFGEHGLRVEQAEHRHHIKPLTERPDLLLDFENHASLCSKCHHQVEALHRAGKPTERFFEGKKRVHHLSQVESGDQSGQEARGEPPTPLSEPSLAGKRGEGGQISGSGERKPGGQ